MAQNQKGNGNFNFSVGLGEGRIPASQMKEWQFDYSPIPFDLKEIEDFTKEIGQAVQYTYGLNDVNMNIKYGFFEDWNIVSRDTQRTKNRTAGIYKSKEHALDIYMDSLWAKTKKLYGSNPTLEQFKGEISNVVAHELRHQWQFDNKVGDAAGLWEDQDGYMNYMKEKLNSNYKNFKYENYLDKPIEIDARNYGQIFQDDYEGKLREYRNYIKQSESKGIEDLDDDTLANLSDEDIQDWAQSGDDYKKALNLREEAKNRINKNKTESAIKADTITPEAPLDVNENIKTHVDNTDTKIDNNAKLPDMDVEGPEVNLEGSKTRRPGRRKIKENLISKADNSLGSSGKTMRVKGSFAKGKNITKGIAQTVASSVLSSAVESLDEVVEEGTQKVTAETIQNFTSNVNSGNNVFNQQTAQNILNNTVNNYTQNRTIGNNTASFNSLNSYQVNNSFKHNGYNYTQPNQTGYTMTPITGVGPNGNLVKGKPQFVPPNLADDADDLVKSFKDVIGKDLIGTGMNILGGVGAYKDARRKGHGVVSSLVRAGADFALGELLGPIGYLALHGTIALGKGAIKGTEMLYKENRRMNSAANMQVFGGAQFQDTQQLATMRQSGMEMAKMAQYNLQQTLMGNEATYLHR